MKTPDEMARDYISPYHNQICDVSGHTIDDIAAAGLQVEWCSSNENNWQFMIRFNDCNVLLYREAAGGFDVSPMQVDLCDGYVDRYVDGFVDVSETRTRVEALAAEFERSIDARERESAATFRRERDTAARYFTDLLALEDRFGTSD